MPYYFLQRCYAALDRFFNCVSSVDYKLINALGCNSSEFCKEAFEIYLKQGADPNLKDFRGNTPLLYAVHEGNPEATKLLIEYGADIDTYNILGFTPLLEASRKGYRQIIDLLLEKGASADEILLGAACSGRHDVFSYGLSKGGNVNYKDKHGYTPLKIACKFGQKNIAEILTHYEIDAYDALFSFCKSGESEIVEAMLDEGADPNVISSTTGVSALITAIRYNNPEVIKALINYGADINMTDNNGNKPLIVGVSYLHINTLDMILNIENSEGEKLIDLSQSFGVTGDNVFMRACLVRSKAVVRKFLDLKDKNGQYLVDVNAKNFEEQSAVMLCADHRKKANLKLLLRSKDENDQFRVKLDFRDIFDQNAYEYIKYSFHPEDEIQNILQQHQYEEENEGSIFSISNIIYLIRFCIPECSNSENDLESDSEEDESIMSNFTGLIDSTSIAHLLALPYGGNGNNFEEDQIET